MDHHKPIYVGSHHGSHLEHYLLAGILTRKGLGNVAVLAVRGLHLWNAEGMVTALDRAGFDFHAIPKREGLPERGIILTTAHETHRLCRRELKNAGPGNQVKLVALHTLANRLLPGTNPYRRRTGDHAEPYARYVERLAAQVERSRPLQRLVAGAAEAYASGSGLR